MNLCSIFDVCQSHLMLTVSTQNKKNLKILVVKIFFDKRLFRQLSTFLSKRLSSSLYLDISSCIEINNVLYFIETNKAIGHDNISACFLQTAFSVITPCMLY